MSGFKHDFAAIIGINQYSNGIAPLRTAVHDALKVAQLLEDKHHYHVWQCLDQEATLANLLRMLETTLPATITPDDRLLFYFAGHGIAFEGEDGPEGYLIPQDAQLGVVSSYLPMVRLNQALVQLPCRHCLVILDCCFAGAFRWSSTRKVTVVLDVIHKERYDRFIQDPAWQVITSAGSNQQAWDVTSDDRGEVGAHSPFAVALMEALKGEADLSPPAKPGKPAGDGVITATELYLYLRNTIEVATEQAGRQTPGLWVLNRHDQGEYIFLTPDHELNLPPAPPLDASKNPYQGLASFEAENRDLFFGRETLTETLCQFMKDHALTVVLGASGSGKSSLVKAGLVPKLQQSNDYSWWILPPLRPGEHPFQSLNTALSTLIPPVEISIEPASGSPSLAESLTPWFTAHPNGKLLLIIDQFEELITLCHSESERQRFIETLATVSNMHSDRFYLLLTLRSDFEPQFQNTALENDWVKARFNVPAMTREELREAIEKPASARVMYFDPPNLVDQVIDEVANMPGALPLLSFALSELYLNYLQRQEAARNRGEIIDRAMTQADYDQIGGVTQSLTQRADQEYENLTKRDPAYAQTVRQVMLRMVALGGDELARRRVALSELDYPEAEQPRVKAVLDAFSQARLLVSGTDANDKPYIEPAHDALVRGWQRLLTWKTEAQETLILQRRLTPAAEEWRQQQKVNYLWNADPRLDLLNQVLQSPHTWFNRIETEFVRQSVRQKRKNTRTRWGIVAGTLIVLSGITFWAVRARRISDLQAQAITATNVLSTDPMQSLLRSIRAVGQNHLNLTQLLLTKPLQAVDASLLDALATAKEENRFLADTRKSVHAIVLSRDGQWIVSGGQDGTVNLWNWQGKRIGQPIAADAKGAVRAVAISSDGQFIVSGGADGDLHLWNKQGQPLGSFQGHNGSINAVAISPDNQTIVSGGQDGTVRIWNQQHQLLVQGHQDAVNAVAISPDGRTIASGSEDGTVRLWNRQGKLIAPPLQGHQGAVLSVAFSPSPDELLIVSGGLDGTVRLWNQQGSVAPPITGHEEAVRSVAFSPDGQTVASSSDDETIRLWNRQGELVGQPFIAPVTSVNAIAISWDGKRLVSGSGNGTIGIWTIAPNPLNYSFHAYQESVNTVITVPNSKEIVSGGNDGTIRLWTQWGRAIGQPFRGHRKFVWSLAISRDGQTIVSGGEDGTIRLWDRQGNPLGQPFLGHVGAVRSVMLSPDDQYIISGSEDGTVRLWNRQGDLVVPPIFADEKGGVQTVAISSDGRIIASGGADGKVHLWNSQGQPIAQLPESGGTIVALAISPDNQTLASSSDNATVQLWNLQDHTLKKTIRNEVEVSAIAFSPNGERIVTGSNDGKVRLWNRQGEPVNPPFSSHRDKIYAVTFPDNETVVSSSRDGTIHTLTLEGWSMWLESACQQLQFHSLVQPPTTDVAQSVQQICQQFWNRE